MAKSSVGVDPKEIVISQRWFPARFETPAGFRNVTRGKPKRGDYMVAVNLKERTLMWVEINDPSSVNIKDNNIIRRVKDKGED